MPDIRQGRFGILQVREKMRTAEKAHTLLKRQLDGLIHELRHLAPQIRESSQEIERKYHRMRYLMAAAFMIEGQTGVMLAAHSVEEVPVVNSQEEDFLGVRVPVYSTENALKPVTERGYGLLATTHVIDDLASGYEELILDIVRHATLMARARQILVATERISRRTRALQYLILPALTETYRTLVLQREEREREESGRLFHLRIQKERQAENNHDPYARPE